MFPSWFKQILTAVTAKMGGSALRPTAGLNSFVSTYSSIAVDYDESFLETQ